MATIAEVLAIAVGQHQAGQLAAAEHLYRQILAADPGQADTWHLLGMISHQTGRFDLAVQQIGEAIRLRGDVAAYHYNRGVTLRTMGNLPAALADYRRAIELQPDYPDAYNNLGLTYLGLGETGEAIACFDRALQLAPAMPQPHINRGVAYKSQGKWAEAIADFRRAIEIQPEMIEAFVNLGQTLREQGEFQAAESVLQRAAQISPDTPGVYTSLGDVWKDQIRFEEAIACYCRALELAPNFAEAYNGLGIAFANLGRLDEAIACFRRVLELKPDLAVAYNNLGNVLKEQGLCNAAIAAYRKSVELRPGYNSAYDNYLYTLNFSADFDAATIYAEHRRWNERCAAPRAASIRPHAHDRRPDRRLRIGYVSPDFAAHPVARFLLPLVEGHDRQAVEVYCYSAGRIKDEMTSHLRGRADVWREILAQSDDEAVEMIRQDQIDILVDLTMHMADSRILVFAGKPAPVQVTYLAYCGTTGLTTTDYRLTDPYLDPPGGDESIYSEESVRLPETYWCYQPIMETPPASPLPALSGGRVTFGCLNNFCKISPGTLEAWGRLLQTVAESRVVIYAGQGSHRERVRAALAPFGVSAERVQFVERARGPDYFRLYDGLDIALDPFPYGGGTTTCDGMWMGVPAVSLRGQTAVGRAGYSLLSNVGLPELVARDVDEYIRIAAGLAADLPRLSELRATLRERMLQSPLMDAPRFVRNVEAAYREMWRRWCAGKG